MSATDHYFTFPLTALHGNEMTTTPLDVLDMCLDCGITNAGIGYRKNNDDDSFKERLKETCDKSKIAVSSRPGPFTDAATILVGAALCNVKLGETSASYCNRMVQKVGTIAKGGPLVRMASSTLWAAFEQARWENNPVRHSHPDRGVSWREFRILAAILSVKTNRADFAFIGWETIQSRSCGFTTKEAFDAATSIPDHLAPPLTRKQIRTTCDTLEALGFYARFRMSQGKTGGLMAYSFRQKDREELGKAVCDHINFRDRATIKANRAKDAEKCLALLERAKVGPSQGQQ